MFAPSFQPRSSSARVKTETMAFWSGSLSAVPHQHADTP
jgi:hypothetical protein